MKRKILIVFIVLIFLSVQGNSQGDKSAFLIGYEGKKEFLYFDSIHKLSANLLSELSNSYDFFVSFRIDSLGQLIDFLIVSYPEVVLPAILKKYIENIFKSSDKKWEPQIRNSKKVVSDEIIYQCSAVKSNQNLEEKIRDSQPMINHSLGISKQNERIKKIDFLPNNRIFVFAY